MTSGERSPFGETSSHKWNRRTFLKGLAIASAGTGAPVILRFGGSYAAVPGYDTRLAPPALDDGLRVAAPSAVGFDAGALSGVLQGVHGGSANTHSVLVFRQGKLVAELYRPGSDRTIYSLWSSHVNFERTDRHDMRSISKSIVSLLYGILLARREVPGIETPVTSLYPEYTGLDDPSRRSIRIRHLLNMTAGLEWTEPSPVRRASSTDESGLFFRRCAYSYVFSRDVVAAPGQRFLYSGGATAVVAEIMERATKRSLRDIARVELFGPLGIADWEWAGNIYGTPLAAAGLRLRPRDLMKIGAMMLARGRWLDRQVAPADWIAQSTAPNIATAPLGGYGFQWWSMPVISKERKFIVTAAIGNGGQRLFLLPDLDLAVVMTGGGYNDPAIGVPLNRTLQQIVDCASG
jgi:CubicO group peptidase (beta-lactamase class C family)